MKIGILGTGFGAFHAELYKKLSDDHSIKIYGRNIDKLQDLQKRLNVEITTDVNDILWDKDIELVDVCMPNFLHEKYVIEALKNGKNVFCETPIALNIDQALRMKEASQKYNKRVFVDNFIKFEPAYKYLYDTVQNNSLGKLKVLHLSRKTPPLWGDLGLETIVTNLMIHEFDFFNYVFDKADTISAIGIQPKEKASHVNVNISSNDAFINIEGSSILPYSYPFTTSYEAIFENGSLEFYKGQSPSKSESTLKLYTNDAEEDIKLDYSDCYELSLNHVLQCIKDNSSSKLSLDSAINSLKYALKVKKIVLSSRN